jgi:hypothetical protein
VNQPVRIMFDIETLSTRFDACVLSIGAVVFGGPSKDTTGHSKSFYVNVSDPEGHIDEDTVRWWLKQDRAAQERLLRDVVPLGRALSMFSVFCSQHLVDDGPGVFHSTKKSDIDAEFWSRSPSFDEVILSSAYRRAAMRAPFFHRWSRDCRTVEAAAGLEFLPNLGIAHDALADATYQAQHVERCLQKLCVYPV